ncbi:MAG: hypothetical protein JSS02_31050 [Planctomycetes bacterium]|nr:hypothetical protein [Planctomycetota bacterium]
MTIDASVRNRWLQAGVVAGVVLLAITLVLPALQQLHLAHEYERAHMTALKFRQVIMEMQNWSAQSKISGHDPMCDIVAESGERLLSWRTWLADHSLPIPYVDHCDYRESWQHPRNLRFAPRGGYFFTKLGHSIRYEDNAATGDDGHFPPKSEDATTILAVTGPGTVFGDGTSIPLTDAPGAAIVLVEVRNSTVHWMAPGDFDIRTMPHTINDPVGQGISGQSPLGFHVAFADGEVWLLSNDTPFEDLSRFFLVNEANRLDREIVLGKFRRSRVNISPE